MHITRVGRQANKVRVFIPRDVARDLGLICGGFISWQRLKSGAYKIMALEPDDRLLQPEQADTETTPRTQQRDMLRGE